MKVSIIILGYNGEKYIEDAFNSLLNLDFPKEDYEIIYLNNGSKDNSTKIAEKYASKNSNIKIINNKNNLGFAGGNNLGIKVSKGKYIALFNVDAIADRNWLSELVNTLESNDQIGAACGKIYYLNSKDLYFGGGKIFYGGLVWNWALNDIEGECDYVSGCAMLINKNVLDKIGFLDEDYFAYYEETDLCTRITIAGYKMHYNPRAIVWHNTPKKAKRPSRNITYLMNRNRVIYCYKNYKYKHVFLVLDLLFLFNIFALYEFLRVPSSIRFIKDVLRARKDSIKYCLR